jgi:predicted transcriptional regulator
VLHENTAFYTPDFADEIDSPEEILADELGVTIRQADKIIMYVEAQIKERESLMFGRMLGLLAGAANPRVAIHAMMVAAGLDQLNGKKSQSDIAKELGCTRALVSHYVLAFRDALSGTFSSFDCYKFRKQNASRETFAKSATDPFTAAKQAAREKLKTKDVKSYIIISTDGRRFIFQARETTDGSGVKKTAKENAMAMAQADGVEIKSIQTA